MLPGTEKPSFTGRDLCFVPLEADLSVAHGIYYISYNGRFNLLGYSHSTRTEYGVCGRLHFEDGRGKSDPLLEMDLKRPNVPVRVSCIED